MTFKIKSFLLSGLVAVFFISLIAPVNSVVHAAGGVMWPTVRLTANTTSAVANGSSTITITATVFKYRCNATIEGQHYTGDSPEDCDSYGGVKDEMPFTQSCSDITVAISTTGEGAILSKNTLSCTDGETFTIKSSVAGAKTVKTVTTWPYSSSSRTSNVLSLNFTAPPAPKPKVVATPTPAPTPAPVVEKPVAPTVATITAGGEEVKNDQPVSVATNEPLVLSGKTVPNGKVAVYVFSEPKLFETTADAEGNWSVKVEGLPEGSHHAEVEVTNPANNQKSDRAKFLEFSVVAAKKTTPTVVATTKNGSSKTGLWIIVGVLVVLLAAAMFWVWKRRQKAGTISMNSTVTPNNDAQVPSDQTDSQATSSSDDEPPTSSADQPR